jgi:alcohol dehydrogenase class IV
MSKVRIHRSPRILITGIGSLEAIGVEALKLGATKACIVTDAGLAQSGLVEEAQRPLAASGIQTNVYDRGAPVPSPEAVAECVAFVESGGHDLIVAFGGASASDMGKLASVLAGSGQTLPDVCGMDKAPRKRLPLMAVPTTAGTGDEVTALAEFSDGTRRQAVVSDHLIPTAAIVDPLLTVSCPPGVTAAAGIDALVHNIEAFVSVHATIHTDSLTRQGVELIGKSLRTSVFDGEDIEARDDMSIGALLGGIGYGNAGLGAVHALAYPITARTGRLWRSCCRGSWRRSCSPGWSTSASWARRWASR